MLANVDRNQNALLLSLNHFSVYAPGHIVDSLQATPSNYCRGKDQRRQATSNNGDVHTVAGFHQRKVTLH